MRVGTHHLPTYKNDFFYRYESTLRACLGISEMKGMKGIEVEEFPL
jgi:hypothetical protein